MAVLVRTRRLSNPSKRRRLVSKKRKNPAKKLSLAQKLHFGTARQRAAARLKLSNPSKRKLKKRVKKTIFGKPSVAKRKRMSRFAAEKRAIRSNRKRRKNVGEIVSIALAGLNPGKRRKNTGMAKRRRKARNNSGTRAGRSWSTYTAKRRKKNPGVRRRRTRKSYSHAAPVRRRRRTRRSNPTFRIRRVNSGRRRRNPGIGGVTTGVIGKAFAVIGGAIGSKYVTQLALGGNNTGYMGYAGNLVAAIGLGWVAGKVTKSKDIATSVMIGGVAGLALRILQDMTSIGQYVNLSLAGVGKGGDLGLGIIQDSSFPVPQTFAPGSMTNAIVPRATRMAISSAQAAQAAQMAVAGKTGMGRMNGRVARRAIM